MSGGPATFGLVLALAATAGLNLLVRPYLPARGLSSRMNIEAEGAIETAALFSLGMRRMAADLALIRMIIYYGTPDGKSEYIYHGHAHDHDGRSEVESYPRLAALSMRLLDLDPLFSYGALFGAGALAFNLDRPDDALKVLQYALARDPKNIQYQAYIAAIGFHEKGDPESVIRILEPFIEDPECPTMIKSMMAFLYRRNGRIKDAIRLYLDIYENSRAENYRRSALKNLKELGG